MQYKVPYWSPGEYQRSVFIELSISDKIIGDEEFYVYIDHVHISDRNGYNLIKRNATSKREYIPLVVKAEKQEKFFDPIIKEKLDYIGRALAISILAIVGINFAFSFFGSGKSDLLWGFLSVV